MKGKRAKFVELAERRVSSAIKQIHLIGNLSNRSAYEYSEKDIQKIFSALQKSMEAAKGRFSDTENSKRASFKL